MIGFLIDANLPYKFHLWNNENFIHVKDIDDEWTDSQIWVYAKINRLTIVSKDTDFSNRIILVDPPPKVIHIKVGNMRMKDFHQFMVSNWEKIVRLSESHKLVNVHRGSISGIK